jgi:hypothetical protein
MLASSGPVECKHGVPIKEACNSCIVEGGIPCEECGHDETGAKHYPRCVYYKKDHPVHDNGYLTKVRVTNGPDKGKTFSVDIYDIIDSMGMKNTAQGQAAKKILRGGRSDKSWEQDMEEAILSIHRAIEREGGK